MKSYAKHYAEEFAAVGDYLLRHIKSPRVEMEDSIVQRRIDVLARDLICLMAGERLSLVDLTILACGQAPLCKSPMHGVKHWTAVWRNALVLIAGLDAAEEDAGTRGFRPYNLPLVALLFALFHDCQRRGEGCEDEHGTHGAEMLRRCRRPLHLFSAEFALAEDACRLHTIYRHPAEDLPRNPRWEVSPPAMWGIGMCLDADRMDLPRAGVDVKIDPTMLYDPEGVRVALRAIGRAEEFRLPLEPVSLAQKPGF